MVVSTGMPPPLASPRQLLAIAHAMEKEAARRYSELSARMKLRDEQGLANLFDFLASVEEKHAAAISERIGDVTDAAFDLSLASWEVPETFDDEAGSSHLLTPYLALAVAVRNEDRAFAFYTYVAADAADEQTKRLAEELASDELDHAALLRRERRKAYAAEGRRSRPVGGIPDSTEELWLLALQMEGEAALYHRALVEALSKEGARTSSFIAAAEDEEKCVREAIGQIGGRFSSPTLPPPSVALEGGLRLLEQAFERYSDISERTNDEEVMHLAITLSTRALRRLSLVLGNLPRAEAPEEKNLGLDTRGSPPS